MNPARFPFRLRFLGARHVWLLLLLLFGLASSPMARAHRMSSASLQIGPSRNQDGWTGRLLVPIRDLASIVDLDRNEDGNVTWGELLGRESELRQVIGDHVIVSTGERACPVHLDRVEIDTLAGEVCASWAFTVRTSENSSIRLRYSLLFDRDPDHRCLVRIGSPSESGLPTTAVLGPESSWLALSKDGNSGSARSWVDFVAEGIHHIFIGYDHVLFLVALLLPSVIGSGGRGSVGAHSRSFRTIVFDVLRIVTAFTVAHSITLGLAAFGVVRLPPRWVETMIALSVVVAAVNNLRALFRDRTWQVAFGFGLVHGFGFAGVLGDLELPRSLFARGVLGFNLGVEAGQLAIVLVFLPVAFALRGTWFYRNLALRVGSVAIAAVAAFWVAQRAFDA